MKKVLGLVATAALMASASFSSATAANLGEKAMMMMQCSSACNVEYLQCVASAQQLASTPQEGMSQLATNFSNSTACGRAALACNASCN